MFAVLVALGCERKGIRLTFLNLAGYYAPEPLWVRVNAPVTGATLPTLAATWGRVIVSVLRTSGAQESIFGANGTWFCRVPCLKGIPGSSSAHEKAGEGRNPNGLLSLCRDLKV